MTNHSDNAAPPRAAVALLRARVGDEEHAPLIGDLTEAFAERVKAHGAFRARLWFWREAATAALLFRRVETRHTGDSLLASFAVDLRVAVRGLKTAPVASAVSLLTLAIAIGASAAMYSVVKPILIDPLSYRDPERLVMVWEKDDRGRNSNTSFATFEDVRRDATSLDGVAVSSMWQATIRGASDAERVMGQRVSWNYFQLLGVRPAIGRDFRPEEDPPGHRTAMLSHGLWLRHFGGDSTIVGRTIDIEGYAFLIAGVMPRGFDNVMSPRAEIWRTMNYQGDQPWACRTCRHLRMIARIRSGASIDATSDDLNRVSQTLVTRYPNAYAAAGMHVVRMKEQATDRYRAILYVLFGATALVVLIALANLVNLQLGRAVQRAETFAVRVMLGASQRRILRMLFAEGLVLGVLAAAGAAAVAGALVPIIVSRLPANMPSVSAVHLDTMTLALIGGVGVVLAIVLAVLPGMHNHADGMARTMRATRGVISRGSRSVRSGLVVAEVALALMLLVATGLLSRSLSALLAVDVGIDAENVLTLEVQATGPSYPNNEAVWQNRRQMLEAIARIPGVEAAGFSSQLPLGGNFDAYGIHTREQAGNPELAPSADRYVITPGFLAAIGTRVTRGRAFDDNDNRAAARPVVLVSEALARQLWPGQDPIGREIHIGEARRPWREVVGVVENVHHRALDNAATDQLYLPEQQWDADAVVALAVRTSGEPSAFGPAIRDAARSVDPAQPILKIAPMTDVIAASIGPRRVALVIFAAFGILAMLLAGAGIYAVLSSNVAARTREIGVRAALGATPARVLRMVVRQSATLVGVGALAGLVGVVALARYMKSLLYAVEPVDGMTLTAVAAGICILGVIAASVPAIRAVRIDPARVLRGD